MELDRMHHIAINVADIEQAVNWYTTSFNCELVFSDAQQAVLRFSNIELHLVLPSSHQPHSAFIRDDAGSFGELREQALGIKSTFLADSYSKH